MCVYTYIYICVYTHIDTVHAYTRQHVSGKLLPHVVQVVQVGLQILSQQPDPA